MPDYPDLSLYIGGQWRRTAETLPVLNPATEKVIGQLPVAGRADLDDALEAAARGFRVWRATSPRARAEVILRATALMRARIDEIAHAITLEPVSYTHLDVYKRQ